MMNEKYLTNIEGAVLDETVFCKETSEKSPQAIFLFTTLFTQLMLCAPLFFIASVSIA